MRRILALFVAVITAVGLFTVNVQNASALGGERLDCRVEPQTGYYMANPCTNNRGPDATGHFTVVFQVEAETAPSTYSWGSIPAGFSIWSGCTSTSSWCSLITSNYYTYFDFGVTLTQGSATEQLEATGSIYPENNCTYC